MDNTALVIKPYNRFLIMDYGPALYGKIEIGESTVKLIPERPKYDFVLYRGYNASKIKSSSIMFPSFSEICAFINTQEYNDTFYKKKDNRSEHYAVNGVEPFSEHPYHDNSIIYEYKKIDPMVIRDKKYTIKNNYFLFYL